MKPVKLTAGILAVIVVGALVFLGIHHFAKDYLDTHDTQSKSEVACKQKGKTHYVVIKDGAMSPQHTSAALCDVLIVTNQDDKIRDLAFGAHDRHQMYDGQTENMIKRGQSVTVSLNKAGSFMFHDHLQKETKGTFTVK